MKITELWMYMYLDFDASKTKQMNNFLFYINSLGEFKKLY